MIADYYFIRNKQLVVDELYREDGQYWLTSGFNRAAVISLIVGILPNGPGFLTTIKVLPADTFPLWLSGLYHYAWFVGFGVSAVVYYLLMKSKTPSAA